jgi:hypothetical protein
MWIGPILKVFLKELSEMYLFFRTAVLPQAQHQDAGTLVWRPSQLCGFEGRAPPPGEHSFTTSLTEVLEDWLSVPAFSPTMLHSEVLRVLMRRRKERCSNGQREEWRKESNVLLTSCTAARRGSGRLSRGRPVGRLWHAVFLIGSCFGCGGLGVELFGRGSHIES